MFDKPQRVQKAAEDQEWKDDKVKRNKHGHALGKGIGLDVQVLALITQPPVIDDQCAPMQETIENVVPGNPVPKAHDQHIDDISDTWSGIPIFKNFVSDKYCD